MNLISKSIFGSHLYGTHTENSDSDFKGIFLPTKEECFLNKISKSFKSTTGDSHSKNTKDDIDIEYYSLQYFMQLAVNGEMIVIDMLHTPEDKMIETSDIWKELVANRSKFYSKNLAGYLGYIRQQTHKYGVKGSRLSAMEEVIKVFEFELSSDKLSTVWDKLPVNEYCRFIETPKEDRWRTYECCGKQIQETVTIGYAHQIIKRLYDSYGERAQLAKENKGIDFKAVSHAFRAGLQLKEIYETGDLKYTLKDADFIRDIKIGKFHYVDDCISEKLEKLLSDIEVLAANSNYPNKIDQNWINNFILKCY